VVAKVFEPAGSLISMKVAGAQLNLTVGDLAGNEARIADAMDWAEGEGADVLLVPELAVPGYPPEDLVLRPSFVDANKEAMRRLARRSGRTTTVIGFVDHADGHRGGDDSFSRKVANAAAVVEGGEIRGVYHKVLLPNYGVFDEDRYFVVGDDPDRTWEIAGAPVGVSICEDIWLPDGPPQAQAAAGAKMLLNINASPFHRGKAAEREDMLAARARAAGAPVVYLNLVGGQDELVFDGASLVLDADGTVLHRSPQFAEDRFVVDVPLGSETGEPCCVADLLEPTEEVYRALVIGLGDYCRKNRFDKVVVSLSGGIDSALTATIAADALGGHNVWGVTMPSRYSSEGSVTDSKALAANLGLRFDQIQMDDIFAEFLIALAPAFEGTETGVAEENIQSRIRGALVMAISNKYGPMVVATGNKSEMAVGYATLYGDMAGGYAVLKDVFKTQLFELARWRNRNGEVIPQSTIDKPPSAELRPDQKDTDSLPPYDILDPILERYIEDDMGPAEIVREGFDEELVRKVARMVDRNEYKRRQAAPGVKITTKAFGRDRRLPITNHFRP
jgi:NAD+ synthase (glutamine-hydrolysing)